MSALLPESNMDIKKLGFDLDSLRSGYEGGQFSPKDIAIEVFRRIRTRGEDFSWSELLDEQRVVEQAILLAREYEGKTLPPLYGIPFSVKDNIDVAAMRTTCGCEGIDRLPKISATSVQKALDAGALLIGKNTLDQFATGLNGTRTMGEHCRSVLNPEYVSGGSSSGSGVAVAAGVVCFSLGTDTGGSGRIPAAMNNIVGIKPTLGLVSSNGLVINNHYFDCVPVFARTIEDGYRVLDLIKGYDDGDLFSREDADAIALDGKEINHFTFGVPSKDQLRFFDDKLAEAAYDDAVAALQQIGGTPIEFDFSLFIEAGRLPFDSGLLAERAASYGDIVSQRPETVHPAVSAMIAKGMRYSGVETIEAVYTMMAMRKKAKTFFKTMDIIVTPTTGRAYKCSEVKENPIEINNNIGYYTYPISPLDLCALAMPAAIRPDGLPFGISLVTLPGEDRRLRAIGGKLQAHLDIPPGIDAASSLDR